jgi:hypothetical protein
MSDFASHLVRLPGVRDDRGALMFAEAGNHVPFAIRRIYTLYDVPAGKVRGAHGHRDLEQLFIAISGSFEMRVSDGIETRSTVLSNPTEGLYIGPMMWREVANFSPGAACLVLASLPYDADDYFHDFDLFRRAKGLT